MIQTVFFETRSDGVNLYHIYSDSNKDLLQVETGYLYTDVIDIENAGYTYQEVERQEDGSVEFDETADMTAALNLLGVNV